MRVKSPSGHTQPQHCLFVFQGFPENWGQRFLFTRIYQKRNPLRDGSVSLWRIWNLRAHKHLETQRTKPQDTQYSSMVLYWSQHTLLWYIGVKVQYWSSKKCTGELVWSVCIIWQRLSGRSWKIRGLGDVSQKKSHFRGVATYYILIGFER